MRHFPQLSFPRALPGVPLRLYPTLRRVSSPREAGLYHCNPGPDVLRPGSVCEETHLALILGDVYANILHCWSPVCGVDRVIDSGAVCSHVGEASQVIASCRSCNAVADNFTGVS
jgi:hypothetical protein